MIFSELYSAYYNTVAAVLSEAVRQPVSDKTLRRIIEKHAFGESIVSIPEALETGRWQLLGPDGTTPLKHAPTMPVTLLQKQWLKAVSQDPRIRLFLNEETGDETDSFSGESFDRAYGLEDVEPLFLPVDYIVFDRYSDGDDYRDEKYIANFRRILDAIRTSYPLEIISLNRRGEEISRIILPEYLEYSEKDDKFWVIGAGDRFGETINVGRIISCQPCELPAETRLEKRNPVRPRSVILELVDERNALERVLLHFAHFKKSAERMEGEEEGKENRYRITIYYDKSDETEMVIRVLSFGPMVKVTAPVHFVTLIKKRLKDQMSCGQ